MISIQQLPNSKNSHFMTKSSYGFRETFRKPLLEGVSVEPKAALKFKSPSDTWPRRSRKVHFHCVRRMCMFELRLLYNGRGKRINRKMISASVRGEELVNQN